MMHHGLEVILDDLAVFASRKEEARSEYEELTARERRKVEQAHAEVSISMSNPRELRLTLMKPWGIHGGVVGGPEDVVVVPLPVTPEKFYDSLLIAAGISPDFRESQQGMNG